MQARSQTTSHTSHNTCSGTNSS